MSVSGNQRTKPNKSSNRTLSALISPVSSESLGDFIGLSSPLSASDEQLLDGLLVASCQYYIDFYANELLSRDYTLKFNSHPRQQEAFSGLGVSPAVSTYWINIPVWPVSDVISATVDDELLVLTDDYTIDLDSKPARVELHNKHGENVIISYSAGYAECEDIPASVLSGIQLMGAYMYDHRGSCDTSSAAKNSGAALMWQSTKMYMSL